MNDYNHIKSYKETQIKTANQGRLIIMLYDAAIKNVNMAISAFNEKEKKLDSVSNNIIKAQDVITELMVSLDFEKGGEISKNLFSLYIFMNQQLLEANLEKKMQPLNVVRDSLMELRDAWSQITGKIGLENQNNGSSGINIAG